MTRIASKFGIAAALTLGVFSTAAAQTRPTTNPSQTVGVSKGEVAPVKPETVTVVRRDTVTVYRRDTVTVSGPTMTRFDTVTVTEMPGWMDKGNGLYFGLGAGSYYPSAALGTGQIPGYAFQMNLGVDPAGSPLGLRVTAGVARPDEAQQFGALGARPTIFNGTADLKLRLPFFRGTRFPNFGLYAVAGGAMTWYKDLVMEDENKSLVLPDGSWHDAFGWNAGGGATVSLGHKREAFVELRAINFMKSGFENGHQAPLIVGVNWY